jgi:hypothetical protein
MLACNVNAFVLLKHGTDMSNNSINRSHAINRSSLGIVVMAFVNQGSHATSLLTCSFILGN